MQLSRSRKMRGVSLTHYFPAILKRKLTTQLKPLGFFATGQQIAARETPLGLYKGLGAVVSGIVPKMAIRFASFESKFPEACLHVTCVGRKAVADGV
jgi:solute carrier family 25 citrate transporter 1